MLSSPSVSDRRKNIDGSISNLKNLDYSSINNGNFSQLLKALNSEEWYWDYKLAESCPVEFEDGNKTAIFHPRASFGTTAISASKQLKSTTIAYWEMHLPALFGSSIMFGVGRKWTKRQLIVAFDHLLGANNRMDDDNDDCESFGLAHSGILYGGKFNGEIYQNGRRYCEELKNCPTDVGILFHGPQGWLTYFINGRPMGIAFTDIDTSIEPYYPMMSSTSQRSRCTLIRQYSLELTPTLSAICINSILKCLTSMNKKQFALFCESTYLPQTLKVEISSMIFKRRLLQHGTITEWYCRKRKPKQENTYVTTADLLNDITIEQLTHLWQKVAEVFHNQAESEIPVTTNSPKRARFTDHQQ